MIQLTNNFWVTLGFFLSSSLPSVVAFSASNQCRWTRLNPQLPQERAICPLPIDDQKAESTGVWDPWTHKPLCEQHGNATTSTFCVFTSSTFRGGDGLSTIMTPEAAASLAGAIEDPYFSWERGMQAMDPSLVQSHQASMWELVDVPGKGKGVVAKRTIQPGEIIMLDYPVTITPTKFFNDLNPQRRGLAGVAMAQLPNPSLVLDLAHSDEGGGIARVDDVIKTNAFGAEFASGQYMMLFPTVARINHGCSPLAVTRYSDRTLAMEVIAAQTIQEGEEITISYTPLGLSSEKRKEVLQRWQFKCRCELCMSKEKEDTSDQHRDRINTILEELKTIEGDFKQIANLSAELFQLVKTERLTANLGEYYEALAITYLRLGHIRGARSYGKRSLKFWLTYDGNDQDRVEQVRRFTKSVDDLHDVLERRKAAEKIRAWNV